MSEEETLDVDNRIHEIYEARERLSAVCDKRGLAQLMREGRRLAKREKRLFDYLSFTYTLEENVSVGPMDRDLCVEMIGLLEDEDRARAFGPNFDLDAYEYTRSWMLPLVYKSLADVTGETEGYNSPGLHSCIAEGMNVCRRMGYREGIINFREFAFEVYQAADDLDMALHFARETIAIQTTGRDRKVASADDAARALGLQGRLSEAVEQVLEGWGYCETFHNPYLAKLNFLPLLRETCAAAGRTDILAEFPQVRWPHEIAPGDEGNYLVFAERGTDPSIEATADRALAVEAACAGDFDKAIALLKPWADMALQHQVIYPLFENRCRLMAVYRLAGRMDELHAMAKATEPIAKRANDWLTLHIIKCLLDENFAANPLGSVGPADCGPYAPATAILAAKVAAASVSSAPEESSSKEQQEVSEESVTPLAPFFHALYERLESGDEQASQEVLEKILQIYPQSFEHPIDAEQALSVLNYLVDASQARAVVEWGDQLLTRFPGESGIVSMVAVLKNTLRELTLVDGQNSSIAQDEIKKLFLRAMDADPECGRSFARAGSQYLNENDFGEAERCLARAFRLNRQSASCALGLADVYANTERPRDALAVLDMALREGCEEPRLAWHAAMHASALDQYSVMLTYLNWYGERVPNQKWLCLFRAIALIYLDRAEEAIQQIDMELTLNPEAERMLPILSACAMAQLKRVEDFRGKLEEVLRIPLREVDVLSTAELSRLLSRLWGSTVKLLTNDPLQSRLEEILIKTCLTSVEFFEKVRLETAEEKAACEVRLYRVYLKQELDDDWSTSEGCLSGEEAWEAYHILWHVLADTEENAIEIAKGWQARSGCKAAPELLGAASSDEVYKDLPGIAAQGPRSGLNARDISDQN